jgi:predicted secreted hydrolase
MSFKCPAFSLKWWIVGGGILFGCLSGQADEWRKALDSRIWNFPGDHGAHPEFRTEWWYFTGHVEDESGRLFGYQLTFFRQGMAQKPLQKSAWALRDVYFAHAALSDVADQKLHVLEKVSRGSLGMADYSREKMDIRLENWSIRQTGENGFALKAQGGEVELSLDLEAVKPKVFHGKGGLSQKAEGAGNASFYYSYTRLQSKGLLRLSKREFRLKGWSWFDHEFSTTALSEQQVGWDWFAIQLESGEELMMYGLRLRDGTVDRYSHGTWVDKNGISTSLALKDFHVSVLDMWKSVQSGGNYPAAWKIEIPSKRLVLEVRPAFADQELRLKGLAPLNYWEGSCKVEGQREGQPTKGRAYVEMTGYAGSLRDRMSVQPEGR